MHSSAEAAVDSLMVAVLQRCFPDVRQQTKFRQYLKEKKVLGKGNEVQKRKIIIEIKLFRKI